MPDRGLQSIEAERLLQVGAHAARREQERLRRLGGAAHGNHHGRGSASLEQIEHLVGAAVGQHDIKQHEIGPPLSDGDLGFGHRSAGAHFAISLSKRALQAAQKCAAVFDHEHSLDWPHCHGSEMLQLISIDVNCHRLEIAG